MFPHDADEKLLPCTDRETERKTERHRDRERDGERERQREKISFVLRKS